MDVLFYVAATGTAFGCGAFYGYFTGLKKQEKRVEEWITACHCANQQQNDMRKQRDEADMQRNRAVDSAGRYLAALTKVYGEPHKAAEVALSELKKAGVTVKWDYLENKELSEDRRIE